LPVSMQPIRKFQELRYLLLAGTLMSAIAIPQWGMASETARDGRIIVAQQNQDPKEKEKNKGKQAPKGAQPGTGQPGGAGQPKQQGTTNQPSPGGQPKSGRQIGNQGPTNQGTTSQPSPGGQPSGRQIGTQGPTNQGTTSQPAPGGQPSGRQIGNQGLTNQGTTSQPSQGAQPKRTGQPSGPEGAPGQQKQLTKQGPANQQFQKGGDPGAQPGRTVQPGAVQQKQFSKQSPGQPGQNQKFGNIEQLRSQRHTSTDPSGRTVIQEGNRMIVQDKGRTFIRSDENERFRRFGGGKVEQRGNETYNIVSRGGYEIINVTDRNGQLIRRIRRGPDRREVVLIDNSRRGPGFGTGVAVGIAAVAGAALVLNLAPPVINIPRDRYIVEMDTAPPDLLYDTLEAPPLMDIERPYSLDEIRYNVELRDRMRRIDINTITFDTGSWEVSPEQFDSLAGMAKAIQRVLSRRPNEVFLIEGHTDAVGQDLDNLTLSDRRAETVAVILTETFQIPPENLVTQGYGEQYLKVQTQDASRLNRRVAVRRIGPLLAGLRE
jgi:outer membrane protein OmpA-like peptidoglycan-associated protein